MVMNFSIRSLMLSGICLLASMQSQAMTDILKNISPEVRQRLGVGALAIAANFVGYASHEKALQTETIHKDFKDSFMWGLRATWLTANLHLLRALISGNSTKKFVFDRGAKLGAATFATEFIWSYLDSKLQEDKTESANWRVIRKALRGALATTGLLANLAILYETIAH